ncbi:hypothetical protein EXU85_20210 [Spirosoma sp. KCTC 42546]|uniref:hypothetical protein n=1 Tax=Spirosoma sp. KCTC 42546 TaxID=2520506 RepID=UPI0011589417|nr:hypothetical protein [Spirosoma sp. KCTC 42546]QDK80803.1 hypothetical protein EXU85_20210 [Spirosoma sp. KCTC 42546]
MPNVALQKVNIKSHLTGLFLYDGKTDRDIEIYPKTLEGRTAMADAIKSGTYPHPITVSNGAVIEANTVPPLEMPDAPATTYPAFSTGHMQAELATGAGSYTNAPGDENVRGTITDSSGNLTYNNVNNTLGATLSGFKFVHRYQTNTSEGGIGAYRINGGSWVNFTMTGNDGTRKTATLSNDITLQSGMNTIDFKWVSGTQWAQDWIEITRDATS